MKIRPGDIVAIDWRDSMRVSEGWAPASHYRGAAILTPTMHSAGFLVEMDDDHVCLTLSVAAEQGDIAEAITVPREAVTKLTLLQRSCKHIRRALK